MRFSVVGILVGALVALIVYVVGTAITSFRHEDLIWGLIALLFWILIAVSWRGGISVD